MDMVIGAESREEKRRRKSEGKEEVEVGGVPAAVRGGEGVKAPNDLPTLVMSTTVSNIRTR